MIEYSETKDYSITSPSINGLLSDDYIYFEGIKRPSTLFKLRDGEIDTDNTIVLDRYWNDIYNLFLRKLTQFASTDPVNSEETLKLQALLQELINVKSLIENTGKTAIMSK